MYIEEEVFVKFFVEKTSDKNNYSNHSIFVLNISKHVQRMETDVFANFSLNIIKA